MGIIGADYRIAEQRLHYEVRKWNSCAVYVEGAAVTLAAVGERPKINYKKMEKSQFNPKHREVLVRTLQNTLENATKNLLERTEKVRLEARQKRLEAEQVMKARAQQLINKTLDRVRDELKNSGIDLLHADLRFNPPQDELRLVENALVDARLDPERKRIEALQDALLRLQSVRTDSEAKRIVESVA